MCNLLYVNFIPTKLWGIKGGWEVLKGTEPSSHKKTWKNLKCNIAK